MDTEPISKAQRVLHFQFDTKGNKVDSDEGNHTNLEFHEDSAPSTTDHARKDSCMRQCCCHKCVICLFISLSVLVLAVATLGIVVRNQHLITNNVIASLANCVMFSQVVLNMDFNAGNYTVAEEESDFLETWEAPEEVKQNAPSYIGRDKNNLTGEVEEA